ncbi:MAG TPA: sigma-70 family RNA polymerase sigma factor [Terriglobales bacterium]|nr:sigma-70 family RNA polymerase sigma factor [Terriglobales bacterium]
MQIANALAMRVEEASLVAELKAGSEDAYAWLVGQFHQPVYSLVYRVVNDPADAADTTQEVFLKVFRGIKHFDGRSSLKTWIYRIALHEASNRRRWWFRHKSRETSIEPPEGAAENLQPLAVREALIDDATSPFDNALHEEMRARIEHELRQVPEPFRTTLVLRDVEELSYEEIAEVMETSLGTVKSRITRGREQLRKRLEPYVQQFGPELGLKLPPRPARDEPESAAGQGLSEAEVV